MQWRRDDGTIAVQLRDGTVRGYPDLGLSKSFSRRIVQADYYWPRRTLILTTDLSRIDLELGTVRNPNPLRRRPVVYLDQNHMSTLSKALRAPQRVTGREWQAAIRLMRLAGEGKIVVPFSGAHMSETAAWTDDEARFHLATTILSVSRGWQLRDPLQVRHGEFVSLLSSFVGRSVPVGDVITLEPNGALASRVSRKKSGDQLIDESPTLLHIHQSTLWLNVAASIMLDEVWDCPEFS